MCGISGIVARRHVNLDAVEAMHALMRHRGPAGEGVLSLKAVQKWFDKIGASDQYTVFYPAFYRVPVPGAPVAGTPLVNHQAPATK